MKKTNCILTTWILVAVLATSCSKDDNPAPPEVIETEPATLTPITKSIGTGVGGYYEAVPKMYAKSTWKYPVLIYLHGAGQMGNGSTAALDVVLNEGTPKLLKEKKFPPNFKVNGNNYSYIVLMPQFKWKPSYYEVRAFVDYALANYRVDSSRIYITGFSMGGQLTCEFAVVDPKLPAAIVSAAGGYIYNLPATAKPIADNKLGVWCFHNQEDLGISANDSKNFVAAINSFNPVYKAGLTIFTGSTSYLQHDSWTKANDPAYKENGYNMYEWMLLFKR
jgi:predicted peptidase